jgi:hypothetical protein
VLDTLVGTRHFCLLYIIPGRNAACPRTKCVCFVATFLLAAPAFSQWNTANVDGIIESGEYGNTANGTNQIGAYEAILVAVTFNTSPGSLSYTVDGTTYTSQQILTLGVGPQHTIATTSPQSQYIFENWSDGGAISHQITISASTTSYTANFGQAPAITSANSTSFTVGTMGSFTVTASGTPTPLLSATTLPGGVTFNAGVLSGTPAAGTGHL